MFTGIVERISLVEQISPISGGIRLEVCHTAVSCCSGEISRWPDLALGESICVDGACLTLVETDPHLGFDVVEESLRRTCLGKLQPGDPVNLERALRVGDRLGGHYVTGHIDTLGKIRSIDDQGETIWVIDHDPDSSFRTVEKGSVTVDGVSLTVVESRADSFSVALIPHTLEVTTFGSKQVGSSVNLEMDHFGRWIDSLGQQQDGGTTS